MRRLIVYLFAGVALMFGGPARPSEVPAGFGRLMYLADMRPGTWYWSETQQRPFLVLTDGRCCDPATGEQWEYKPESSCGWVCQVRLSVTRPNGLDIRPWSAPEKPTPVE